jgi:hypothetical protein
MWARHWPEMICYIQSRREMHTCVSPTRLRSRAFGTKATTFLHQRLHEHVVLQHNEASQTSIAPKGSRGNTIKSDGGTISANTDIPRLQFYSCAKALHVCAQVAVGKQL